VTAVADQRNPTGKATQQRLPKLKIPAWQRMV
jgi:hypothetical protein